MSAPSSCPSCGSVLLQALRSRAGTGETVLVDLRCPECRTWIQARATAQEARRLDRAQAAARHALLDAYERSVAQSMEHLAFCLHVALEEDLVGADDFAPRVLR